ncbi:putative kinase [Naumannella cuiyingiana]|uniref:Putative kinase n=1 Tax=Naumannella cuiyingiana TaxID=1347891 RepID=A0A7Z0D9G5_9ACTN|nr:AAA family ATPase [Naumannella cuiyingiana]NYI71205.1 putative kinase [Naumannella cuiyingiana]
MIPSSRAPADLVLLGGVPGAGKSTALRALAARRGDLRILDSEQTRARLAAGLRHGLAYRYYRPLVHLLHHLAVLARVLIGPRARLVVHDPGTRGWTRRLLLRIARWRGWTPSVVFIDVARSDALAGQVARQRMVRAGAFDRHWATWSGLRVGAVAGVLADEPWRAVRVADRRGAVRALLGEFGLTGAGAGPVVPALAA